MDWVTTQSFSLIPRELQLETVGFFFFFKAEPIRDKNANPNLTKVINLL